MSQWLQNLHEIYILKFVDELKVFFLYLFEVFLHRLSTVIWLDMMWLG